MAYFALRRKRNSTVLTVVLGLAMGALTGLHYYLPTEPNVPGDLRAVASHSQASESWETVGVEHQFVPRFLHRACVDDRRRTIQKRLRGNSASGLGDAGSSPNGGGLKPRFHRFCSLLCFSFFLSFFLSSSLSALAGLTFTWWGCYGLCLRHKLTELAHSFLVCFCLYGPFNCISFQ